MKKSTSLPTFLSLLTLFTISSGMAQNLVPNPSFEDYTDTYCGIVGSSGFDLTIIDWQNPTSGAPQVFFSNIEDSCFNFQPNTTYSGPLGIKGNQTPRMGSVMAGVWLYTVQDLNQRQYIQAELTSPMEVGKTYVVEFHISLADFMEYSIDKVGAHLSTSAISSSRGSNLNYTPQIAANGFVDETTEWVVIGDTIVATEAYTHITIGNFYDDDATNTQANPLATFDVSTYGAYYFIDDVRVEELVGASIDEFAQDDVRIYPSTITNVLNVETPEGTTIEVYNTFGQRLFSSQAKSGNESINTSDFARGVYLVHLTLGSKKLTRKIVK